MIKKLLAHANRGILLDVVVFLVNVILMTLLSGLLVDLIHRANTDVSAQVTMVAFCLGLVFLQPTGALLKRRRAHLRRPDLDHVPFGRLVLLLIFPNGSSAAGFGLVELVLGKNQGRESAFISGFRPGSLPRFFWEYRHWPSPIVLSCTFTFNHQSASPCSPGCRRRKLSCWATCSSF
jgi:hypothetical protein